jgi:hypothetical protein
MSTARPAHVLSWLSIVGYILLECPMRGSKRWLKLIRLRGVTDREHLRRSYQEAVGFTNWNDAYYQTQNSQRWGPVFWQALHNLSCCFETVRKKEMRDLFRWLPYVLPCRPCRIHILENLAVTYQARMDIHSRKSCMNYVVRLHNMITKQLSNQSKPQLIFPLLLSVDVANIRIAFESVRNHDKSTVVKVPNPTLGVGGCTLESLPLMPF